MLLSTIGHRLNIHTPYRTNVSNLQYNKPKHEPKSFINSQVISYECLQSMYLSNSQQPHSTFFLFGTREILFGPKVQTFTRHVACAVITHLIRIAICSATFKITKQSFFYRLTYCIFNH